MSDCVIVHESVLYNAFGESVDETEQKNAEEFLNKCGNLNYDDKNFAYLPGQIFERICTLGGKKGWDKFIAFCEMLIIKYTTKECKDDNCEPYVYLASDLCITRNVFIISSHNKFDKWVSSQGYLFPIFPVKIALDNLF